MSVAVASILPTPIMAVSLISELFTLTCSRDEGMGSVYLKFFVSAGIGGCVAFTVAVGIGVVTYDHLSDPYYVNLAVPTGIFADFLPLKAILLGLIGCFLGYVFLAAKLICKRGARRLSTYINSLSEYKLGTILTPAVGGIFVGIIAWILPGTTGIGEEGMRFLAKSQNGQNEPVVFVSTGLLKLLSLAICMSFGWTG